MDPENNQQQNQGEGAQNQGQQQGQQQQEQQNQGQQQEGKNYTQAQINAMMANEKRTARQALLKELGFDVKDDQSFTDTLAGIKKTLDAGKTQQQLDQEAKNKAEGEAKDANARAAIAEMKVSALTAGVNPKRLDDMILLAQAKIAKGQTADQAFADLKKDYPDAFGTEASGGTGSHVNPANKTGGNDGESRGARLAKQNKTSAKSSYFKH